MTFYCKHCEKDIVVDDKEAEGYYNWKCPECNRIAQKKEMALGVGIIWNCDTGTTPKKSYTPSGTGGSSCQGCPNAGT
jgi:hypothetical protein